MDKQYKMNTNDRLIDVCIISSTDTIPLEDFLQISNENEWVDYLICCTNVMGIMDEFGCSDLSKHLIINPFISDDDTNKIEIHLMYDLEDQLYLSWGMLYDLDQHVFLHSFYEYNARLSPDIERPAFLREKQYGPFFADHPINDQEFTESVKSFTYRIRNLLGAYNGS